MFTQFLDKFKRIAWFLPGFLLWAAFPPMGERADCLFALAPLLWLSRQGNVRVATVRWLQSGAFYWLATLAWMPAIIQNGGPWPLVVLGWGALAAYCAAYFAAYGFLSAAYWRWTKNRWLLRLLGILLVEPLLWCGLEIVRSRFLGGFAWNQLGVVPANTGFGAPAALAGVYALSAVVIWINGSLAGIAERMVALFRRQPVSRLRTLETVLVFAVIWGIYALSPRSTLTLENDGSASYLKAALVQRNFPCVFQKGFEESPTEAYAPLVKNVAPLSPDLVVLSESAFCEVGRFGTASAARFAQWLCEQAGATAVLAGGTRETSAASYNSAALYEGEAMPQIYDKVHLVPFGEFIPGDKRFPVLQKFAPVGSCTPGECRLLTLELARPPEKPRKVSLGIAICFEDTDSAHVRKLAELGADALVFITNDSWFSHSDETRQHAWQATARALETHLPVIRVGNSGVSGTILPDGRATWLTDENGRPRVDARGAMFDRIPLAATGSRVLPSYVRWGDAPIFAAFILLILAMILVKYTNYYEQRRIMSL